MNTSIRSVLVGLMTLSIQALAYRSSLPEIAVIALFIGPATAQLYLGKLFLIR